MKPIVDMHNHTNLSACCQDKAATCESFVEKAAELGVQVLGISNHCWDHAMPGASAWYAPQDVEHNLPIYDQIPADTKGVKVFIGIESEYYGMRDQLGISLAGAQKFDYVLIPHSHTHMKEYVIPTDPFYAAAIDEMRGKLRAAFPEVSERQIDKWVAVCRQPDVQRFVKGVPVDFVADFMRKSFVGLLNNAEVQKIKDKVPTFVAHPFIACGYPKDVREQMAAKISDEEYTEMFKLMAEKGIGYDISIGNFMIDKPDVCQNFRLVRLAKACGVKFIFGTDAHSVAALGGAVKSADIFRIAGLEIEDLHPMIRDFVK